MSTSFKSLAVIGAAAIAVLASPATAQAFPGQPKLLQGTGVFTVSRIYMGPIIGYVDTSINSPFTFSISYRNFMGSDTILPGLVSISAPTISPNLASFNGSLGFVPTGPSTTSVTAVNYGTIEYLELDLDVDGSFLVQPGPASIGSMSTINYGGRRFGYTGTITSLASVFEVAAVPEPASWAMMLVGFGAVGLAMRSAKRRSDVKFDMKIKRIAAGLEV